ATSNDVVGDDRCGPSNDEDAEHATTACACGAASATAAATSASASVATEPIVVFCAAETEGPAAAAAPTAAAAIASRQSSGRRASNPRGARPGTGRPGASRPRPGLPSAPPGRSVHSKHRSRRHETQGAPAPEPPVVASVAEYARGAATGAAAG